MQSIILRTDSVSQALKFLTFHYSNIMFDQDQAPVRLKLLMHLDVRQ